VALSGSLGVSGYVSQTQSEGAITYVEYSYALNTGFPVVKVLNAAGYYTEPTAQNVAVAMLTSQINSDKSSPQYLTQILDGVYNNADRRTYPLSSYSYMIIPTKIEGSFNTDKGHTLGAFANYFLCEGQQQTPLLGYSPLPINLVQAGIEQVKRIPGVDTQSIDIKKCNNPTFSATGMNLLATTAPQPAACDKQGPMQCGTGTGGTKQTTTTSGASGRVGETTATGTTVAGSTTTSGTTGGTTGGASGSVRSGAAPVTGTLTTDSGVTAPGIAAGTSASGDQVAAVPVAVSLGLDGGSGSVLSALAGIVLLGVALLPPLLARRLAKGRR